MKVEYYLREVPLHSKVISTKMKLLEAMFTYIEHFFEVGATISQLCNALANLLQKQCSSDLIFNKTIPYNVTCETFKWRFWDLGRNFKGLRLGSARNL